MFSIRHVAVALGFAASMAGVLTLAPETAAQTQPPPFPPQVVETHFSDPIELFERLMPVFSHPRCANCHSDMDPRHEANYRNHLGGFVGGGQSCTETCHTDEPEWTRTAPPQFKFAGLNTKDLCLAQKQFIKDRGAGSWLNHLSTDKLIIAGFAGTRAGMTDVADQPPMDQDTFVEKAADWLSFGMGSCGQWDGTITQTETLEGTYDYSRGGSPPSTTGVVEEAERVLTLRRTRGVSTVTYNSVAGHSELTNTDFIPLDGGICKTVYQASTSWGVLERGTVPAEIQPRIEQDGTYGIRFKLPRETVEQADTGTMISECVSLPPADPMPNTVTTWSAWKFLISCPPTFTQDIASGNFIDCELFDPEKMPRLKGKQTRTIYDHEDAGGRQSWLRVSPASGSRLDNGKSIPIKVITTWDFQVVE